MGELEQWDEAAERYAYEQERSAFAEGNKRIVMERFRELKGKSLLDLGCGYGWYTAYFRAIGAKAIGCDGSGKMIELAKSKYPNGTFDRVDLLDQLPYADQSFDVVFCNQVLMDLDPIFGVVGEVGRVLRPKGIFYMSIVHPAFFDSRWEEDGLGFCRTKTMERYLSHYSLENSFWGRTKQYHRTVGYYINTIIDAGFRLLHMEEPQAYDGVRKTKEFPLFLFLEFEKMETAELG